jgi:hypothetical protein
MSVPQLNLSWEQGDDLLLRITYKEGAAGEEPVAKDLTQGYSVRMDIRTTDVQNTHLYTFNSDDVDEPRVDEAGEFDNEVVLNKDGEIAITIPRHLTLPGGTVYNYIRLNNIAVVAYDVFLRDNNANRQQKILSGTITINPSVTLWS